MVFFCVFMYRYSRTERSGWCVPREMGARAAISTGDHLAVTEPGAPAEPRGYRNATGLHVSAWYIFSVMIGSFMLSLLQSEMRFCPSQFTRVCVSRALAPMMRWDERMGHSGRKAQRTAAVVTSLRPVVRATKSKRLPPSHTFFLCPSTTQFSIDLPLASSLHVGVWAYRSRGGTPAASPRAPAHRHPQQPRNPFA